MVQATRANCLVAASHRSKDALLKWYGHGAAQGQAPHGVPGCFVAAVLMLWSFMTCFTLSKQVPAQTELDDSSLCNPGQ